MAKDYYACLLIILLWSSSLTDAVKTNFDDVWDPSYHREKPAIVQHKRFMFNPDLGKRMFNMDLGKRMFNYDLGKRMFNMDLGKKKRREDN